VVRQAFAAKLAALGIALVFARDPGCGGVESTSSGINAPCTRDRDCKDELTCEKGVCTGHSKDDAGADASQDAGGSDAGSSDAGDGG
jgi:hypothetical protein